jgi:hypothetical protein
MLTTLQKYTGWFILATLILFIISGFYPSLFVTVSILAWLVVIIEWNRLAAAHYPE